MNSNRQKQPIDLITKFTQSSWSSRTMNCNKMAHILMHRVVRSVVNLQEQTQGTEQQSLPSRNLSALRTTVSSKHKWDSADGIYTGAQFSKLDKTYALKQPLSTQGQSKSFPARRTSHRLLAAFDTISRKWVSNINFETKVTQRSYVPSLTPQL